jgi:dTDP-4-dehydrorhamnose reductase
MKILLIGANGQLGHDLLIALKQHDVLPTARGASLAGEDKTAIALDVCDTREVRATINSFAPAVVINCSAFHRVDDIEKDASQALAVNAQAVQQLALASRDANASLLHVSTDYVFDGTKTTPYTEADLPNPISAYGASKVAGELLLRAAWHKHYIVRTCGLYGIAGASGKGGNFVNTMLRLANEGGTSPTGGKPIKVVNDQTCTPTFTKDLATQIATLIETNAFGTYHITSAGGVTWHDFAAEIFRLAKVKADLRPTTSAEFNAPAKRPAYSVLENAGLQKLGIDHMRDWHDALAEYIQLRQVQK